MSDEPVIAGAAEGEPPATTTELILLPGTDLRVLLHYWDATAPLPPLGTARRSG